MTADPPPALPGPVVPGPPRGMLALGARLGAGAWWCERVFTVAGDWVPTTDEAAVRVHLAELSRVAGDHALALRRHLPRPTDVDPEGWVVPPTPGASGLVTALGRAGAEATVGRLAVLHRVVVPRLLATWRSDAAGAGVADRGVARTLRHAHADLTELWQEGSGLLDALLLADPPAAAVPLAWAVELEIDLAAGGGAVPDPPSHLPM